jgi:hypothetical protein
MTDKQIGMDEMKLRDYFAGLAMQAILKDQYEDGLYVGDGIENVDLYAEVCAVSSYIMADAMIKARNGTY